MKGVLKKLCPLVLFAKNDMWQEVCNTVNRDTHFCGNLKSLNLLFEISCDFLKFVGVCLYFISFYQNVEFSLLSLFFKCNQLIYLILVQKRQWAVERDGTDTYAYAGDQWVSFDDPAAVQVKVGWFTFS